MAVARSDVDSSRAAAAGASTLPVDPDTLPTTPPTPAPTVPVPTVTLPASTSTSTSSTTTTVAPATSTTTASTTAPPTTVAATAPATSPAPAPPVSTKTTAAATPAGPPPATNPPTSNCSVAGTISIPAIAIEQPLLLEAVAFKDGLLCGNHKSDHSVQGVDILPGYAALADSIAGGDALIGKVPTVIFGHRKSHNHPFLNNPKLRAGDSVVVTNLDGSEHHLHVVDVQLMSLSKAEKFLLSPSPDGAPVVRLVCCSHADGTPGGVNYRWVVSLAPD